MIINITTGQAGRTPPALRFHHVMFIVYTDTCLHTCLHMCHVTGPKLCTSQVITQWQHVTHHHTMSRCHWAPSLTSPGSGKQLTRTQAHDTGTGLKPAWREGAVPECVHLYSGVQWPVYKVWDMNEDRGLLIWTGHGSGYPYWPH